MDSPHSRHIKIIIIAVICVAAIILYYFFNPAACTWMPHCPVKQLTGYDCPSCGSQRAFHALLHGNLTDAVMYNPFLVISLPYFICVVLGYMKNGFGRMMKQIFHSKVSITVYIVLFFAWWIIRNIAFA